MCIRDRLQILRQQARTTTASQAQPVMDGADVAKLRALCDQIYVDEKIEEYVVDLVHATRQPGDFGLEIGDMIQYGASPRATIYLTMASRAKALLEGRGYVTPQDVKAMAPDVLRHRVVVTYEAEAEERTADSLVAAILDAVPVP